MTRAMSPSSLKNLRPGGPGRKKGVPNRATVEVKEAARAFLADPAGQAKLLEQYQRGKLHPSVLAMFYHYAFGKPAETVNLNSDDAKPWVVVLPAPDPVTEVR